MILRQANKGIYIAWMSSNNQFLSITHGVFDDSLTWSNFGPVINFFIGNYE